MLADIKIVSLNERGIRGEKRHSVFRWLNEKKYDVCFLQETYCTDNFVTTFKRGWKGEVFHATSDSSHSRGVCIMLRDGLDYIVMTTHK